MLKFEGGYQLNVTCYRLQLQLALAIEGAWVSQLLQPPVPLLPIYLTSTISIYSMVIGDNYWQQFAVTLTTTILSADADKTKLSIIQSSVNTPTVHTPSKSELLSGVVLSDRS